MDRLSVGKERLDNGEAANIFGDAINRSEVHIMREIVPALDLMVVMELLQGNNYDLERSIDAALALMASLAAEDGRAILSDAYTVPVKSGKISGSSAAPNIPTSNATPKTSGTLVSPKITKIHRTTSNKDDFLPPTAYFPSAPSSSSRPPSQSKSGATGSGERRGQESRGVPMILSEKFLAAPRFRLVVNRHTNAATDFTIYFRRKTEKLGITIQEQDSEIRIHTLHAKSPTEPLLALESGIRIGDILTGVNSEYFSSGAEVQDIIDILHLTGTFVTLHFTRRYLPEDIQIQSYLSPNHKFARMLMDQTVINKERAGYVTKALRRLKERSLSWDSVLNSERIEGWKLDTFLTGGSKHHTHTNVVTPERFPPHIPKSASSSSSMSSGRRSLDSNHRTFDSSSSSGSSSHIPPARHLRPAISVRVIRAEERTDHVVYVIWVMDVKSGAEWFVRRRFREFHDFKDVSIPIFECLCNAFSIFFRHDFMQGMCQVRHC